MSLLSRLCVAVASFATAVVCQSEPVAFEVRLEPRERVVAAGSDIRLQLTVEVKRDAAVPAALLSGLQLDTKIGDQPGPRIDENVTGSVQLTADTVVRRTILVPSARIPLPAASELLDVTLSWRDMPSATAVVKVAPDSSKIELDKLDLTKTKVMLLTNYGSMVVRFYPDKAPEHVKSFIKLSKDHFYDGTKFHRIIKGFMIQGGCPNTKEGATGQPGTGNPGYTLKAEFNDVKHERGVLSMARSGHPDSAGSQFFVMHGSAPGLDKQYSAFGVLDSGFDTLDKITNCEVSLSPSGEPSVPVKPVHLHAAIVLPVLRAN